MRPSRIAACLAALVAGGLAQRSYAQESFFSAEVIAQAIETGEGITVLDSNTSFCLNCAVGTSLGAEVLVTHGGVTATAIAGAGFNELVGYVHVVAERSGAFPDLNSLVGGLTESYWKDRLFFDVGGERVNSGSVLVEADFDGHISLSGEGAGARATVNLNAGPLGETIEEVSFTEAGSVDSSIALIYTGDLSEGLRVELQLLLGAGNSSFLPSTSTADFDSTATITRVAFLTPQGLPDPSVNVTSDSGVVYGVPEPSGGALAIVCLGWAGGRFGRPRPQTRTGLKSRRWSGHSFSA